MSAVIIVPSEQAVVRSKLREAASPHRDIHMTRLNDQERMRCAKLLPELDLRGYIFSATGGKQREMRNILLESIADVLKKEQVSRAVLESCGQDHEDRQILQRALLGEHEMKYEHMPKGQELLLALPDIHAWCWGGKPKYRQVVEPITTPYRLVDLR